ncbi:MULTISPECIES: methyl-accepting chemotaxis protein [Priestia]|uniref:methyl-accepting chemotaxis protein n=1 Tax=Priestia TaxID=2800373 RepID=UPI002877F57D|nr:MULTISPECIES: methyl-accepting chemotaxis protein [Priestia]MBX4159809.1 hypothetical protein [Priestia megaterium]MED3897552.1 methyl-accepting chemotaxis protein [Priestia aryabhattai]
MNKHKLMVVLSSGAVILSLLIHIIHRIWPMGMSGMSMEHNSTPGEHGKGFAVVAAEVRKLAEQSNQSAEQVARLIQHIQQETSQAVAFIQSGTANVKTGILLANEAENVFNRIADASAYVQKQIQQTAASAQQIAAGSTQVLHAVSDMTSFANQSAASSTSISSASVRQLQSLQIIDQTAEFLSGLVEELGSVTEKLAKQA